MKQLRIILTSSFLFTAAAITMIILSGLAPARASAQTEKARCVSRPIFRGLWAGVNFDLGGLEDCEDQTNQTRAQPPQNQTSQPPASQNKRYYAFGDSVAAGAGLPSQGTNASGCETSSEAYPALLAAEVGLELESFACSGATAGDLVTEQHLSGTSRDIEPQLHTAFAHGTPSVMTITAGANDLYWENYLRYCYRQNCGGRADSLAIAGLRSVLQIKLETVFESVRLLSDSTPPQTFISGYYRPFASACTQPYSSLSASNIRWLNRQVDLLNATIQRAANKYDFVHYVPVNFEGHELCSEEPWIQGMNDPAPFHPTAAGQAAIARAVNEAL